MQAQDTMCEALQVIVDGYNASPLVRARVLYDTDRGLYECVLWSGSGTGFRCQRFTVLKESECETSCRAGVVGLTDLVGLAERRIRFWFAPPKRYRKFRRKAIRDATDRSI